PRRSWAQWRPPRQTPRPKTKTASKRSNRNKRTMTISAALVKELRQRTGAGMMECKRALQAANGDIDAAAETMRKEGLAKADKKAGRIAAEGRIATAQSSDGRAAVLLEINCETDFVGKNEDFVTFGDRV